jgi:hypothetical protein
MFCGTLTALAFPRWLYPSPKKWSPCLCCAVALSGAVLVQYVSVCLTFCFRTLQVIIWFRQTVSKTVGAETRVLSQASRCEIFGRTKCHWNRFLLRMLEISLSVSFYRCVTLIRCSYVTAVFTVCSQLTASVKNTLKNIRVCAH